jgi:hypothetical protein
MLKALVDVRVLLSCVSLFRQRCRNSYLPRPRNLNECQIRIISNHFKPSRVQDLQKKKVLFLLKLRSQRLVIVVITTTNIMLVLDKQLIISET